MGLRVVSTKLTEEEHSKLLDVCNKRGCVPSALIKQAIMDKIEAESEVKEKPLSALEKLLKQSKEEKPETEPNSVKSLLERLKEHRHS